MIGLTSRPGTAVLPTWWMPPRIHSPITPCNASRSCSKRVGQPGREGRAGWVRLLSRGRRRDGQQSLHDQDVAPGAVELPMATMNAYRLKAAALDEANAGELSVKSLPISL
jgi:hypothetical protein